MADNATYDRLADEIRKTPTKHAGPLETRALVKCGTLAASSHNTQPWKFTVGENSITIRPDFTRRCPVVDPDDAHLYKSLGCAAENISLAAAAQGYASDVVFDEEKDGITMSFKKSSSSEPTNLFKAIFKRQCTRTAFDGGELGVTEPDRLKASGNQEGIRTLLLTSNEQMTIVADFVDKGNRNQLSNPAFRKELISWIRFNPKDSLLTRDGLSNRTSGNPALPKWLAKKIIGMVLTPGGQAKTDREHIKSSSAIAVIVAERNDRQAWVNAGRAYERLALAATEISIRHAFINQPIEDPALRSHFESYLGLKSEYAQLVLRLGRAPTCPYSLRRPPEEVIE